MTVSLLQTGKKQWRRWEPWWDWTEPLSEEAHKGEIVGLSGRERGIEGGVDF